MEVAVEPPGRHVGQAQGGRPHDADRVAPRCDASQIAQHLGPRLCAADPVESDHGIAQLRDAAYLDGAIIEGRPASTLGHKHVFAHGIVYHAQSGLTFTWGSVSPAAVPNGQLLLAKNGHGTGAHDFVLIGRETLDMELFRLGANRKEGAYYLWYNVGSGCGAWWGRRDLAGAPGVRELPIDPNQLLGVLTICELPATFSSPPTVAMTMNTRPGECAYVLAYLDREPITGRILFRREMHFTWREGQPRRCFLVNFFDRKGRRVMVAKLKDYKPIDLEDVDPKPEAPPTMATSIEITWLDEKGQMGSRMRFRLSDMTTA